MTPVLPTVTVYVHMAPVLPTVTVYLHLTPVLPTFIVYFHLHCPQSWYTFTCTAHSRCIFTPVLPTVTAYFHLYCPQSLYTDTCTAHSHWLRTPVLPTSTVYWYLHCRQSLHTYTCTAQSLYHTTPDQHSDRPVLVSGQAWCCQVILMVFCLQSPLCGEAYRRPSGCESFFEDCPPAIRSELGQPSCSQAVQSECPLRRQWWILWLWWSLHW